MAHRLAILLIGVTSAVFHQPVQAQSCSASASPINFGAVSPIRLNSVDAAGSITVTCNWPVLAVNRNVRVCLNLGNGAASSSMAPRYLSSGANTMRFNLYRDAGRSQIWGSIYSGTANSPISLVLSKPFAGTTASTTVPYYGRIEANQPAVPVTGSMATVYSNAFTSTHTSLNTYFYDFIERSCTNITAVSSNFPFTANAQVINDCTISATDLNFPTTGMLDKAVLGTGGLNVRCTNGNAWRISLNGGGSGNVLQRRMLRAGGGPSVAYQLYTSSARTLIWGDGSGGTTRVTSTGTGQAQSVPVYGVVPPQSTPVPGSYRDTITATVSF